MSKSSGGLRVLVLVPFPLDAEGVENRRAQLATCRFGADIRFDYRPVKAGPALFDSHHDWLLGELALCEAGLSAQAEGYQAVCIDTMSDSGVSPLRSVLDIPVIGPARTSYLAALMLGDTFSVLTQWDPWKATHTKNLQELGLAHKCASVRSIGVPPDLRNLLGGKESVIFPRLEEEARRCIEDGADVVVLGSTTMHQAHGYLAGRLPVPVISPGPLSYKIAETLLGVGLSHSRRAYPKPRVPKARMVEAMLERAAEFELPREKETRR